MTKHINGGVDLTDLGDSYRKYLRRQIGWIYMFVIVIFLFGVIYIYSLLNQAEKVEVDRTSETQVLELKSQIESQDKRIEQLEKEIKKLQNQ